MTDFKDSGVSMDNQVPPTDVGDGWIVHDGGPNPVPGQRVEWRNSAGQVASALSDDVCGLGAPLRSNHPIIAYRLSRPAPVPEAGEGVEPWEPVAESVCAEVIKRAEVTCRKATDELYEGLLYSVQDYLRENVMLNLSGELDRAHGYERDARAALVEVAKAAGVDFVDSRDGVERQKERILAALHPAPADRVAELEAALRAFVSWGESKCPCYNDLPNPCPLCDASVENLEGCKAADKTIPPRLLGKARALLSAQPRAKGEGK